MSEQKYLGHSADYWLELQKRAHALNTVDLLVEVVELRGKVSFYESRIKDLADFRQISIFSKN